MAPNPAKALPKPTDSELELLRVLWKLGPATVRQVHESQDPAKTSGYTTTLKLMQIMTDKGLVKRNTDQRSHIYEPIVKEYETQQNLLSEFLDATYRGSASTLVLQALGQHQSSKEELKKIKEFIANLESKSNNK